MPISRHIGLAAIASFLPFATPVFAQSATSTKVYQVEWVYRVKYGFEDEWWRIFQKYQVAALDEEKRRGFVRSYSVFKPGLHTS